MKHPLHAIPVTDITFCHYRPCRIGFIIPILPTSAVTHPPTGDKIAGSLKQNMKTTMADKQ